MDATPESGTATPIFDAVASLLREQSAFALATVVEGPGAGAKLLVRPEGTMGTLGDANLDRVVERDALGELAAGRAVPIGRVAEPEEAGDVITFLASARASYLTGIAVNLDGGVSAVV